jgi:hypothetical protein
MSLMATAWQMRKRMVSIYLLIPVERTIGTIPCAKAQKECKLGLLNSKEKLKNQS